MTGKGHSTLIHITQITYNRISWFFRKITHEVIDIKTGHLSNVFNVLLTNTMPPYSELNMLFWLSSTNFAYSIVCSFSAKALEKLIVSRIVCVLFESSCPAESLRFHENHISNLCIAKRRFRSPWATFGSPHFFDLQMIVEPHRSRTLLHAWCCLFISFSGPVVLNTFYRSCLFVMCTPLLFGFGGAASDSIETCIHSNVIDRVTVFAFF